MAGVERGVELRNPRKEGDGCRARRRELHNRDVGVVFDSERLIRLGEREEGVFTFAEDGERDAARLPDVDLMGRVSQMMMMPSI